MATDRIGSIYDVRVRQAIMYAIDTLERANGFPQIAIDPKSNRLYVTWSDYRNGDIDVFVRESSDKGKHWSPPTRVNNDPIHDGVEQFFQWLAVDPVDGSVNVVFYDRRGDPTNRKQTVVLARSTDAGRTFNNYSWTTDPFEVQPGVFFGDYSGLAAYGGRVYGIWTEEPPPPASQEGKETKDSKNKDKSEDSNDPKSKRLGTVVKLGTADFGGANN